MTMTDDDDDRADADGGEQRRRRECRVSAAFVACFQSSHIWGNLVSSLMLDDRLRDGAPPAPAVVEDGGANSSHLLNAASDAADPSAGDGVYCGVYTPCGVSPASDDWNWANPGTANRVPVWCGE